MRPLSLCVEPQCRRQRDGARLRCHDHHEAQVTAAVERAIRQQAYRLKVKFRKPRSSHGKARVR